MIFMLLSAIGILLPVIALLLRARRTKTSTGLACTGLIISLISCGLLAFLRSLSASERDDATQNVQTIFIVLCLLGPIISIISLFFMKSSKAS